jgi:hypothetical protein
MYDVLARHSGESNVELDDIWYYIARDSCSMEIADRLIDSITDGFFLLGNHPYEVAPPPTICAPVITENSVRPYVNQHPYGTR